MSPNEIRKTLALEGIAEAASLIRKLSFIVSCNGSDVSVSAWREDLKKEFGALDLTRRALLEDQEPQS